MLPVSRQCAALPTVPAVTSAVVVPSATAAAAAPASPGRVLHNASARDAGLAALDAVQRGLPECPTLSLLSGRVDRAGLRKIQRIREGRNGGPLMLKSMTNDEFHALVERASAQRCGDAVERVLYAARFLSERGYPWPVSVMAFEHPDWPLLQHALLWIQGPDDDGSFFIDPVMACLDPRAQQRLAGSVFDPSGDHPAAFLASRLWACLYCCWIDVPRARWVAAATIPQGGGFRHFAEVVPGRDGRAQWQNVYSPALPDNPGAAEFTRYVRAQCERFNARDAIQLAIQSRQCRRSVLRRAGRPAGARLTRASAAEAGRLALMRVRTGLPHCPAIAAIAASRGGLEAASARTYYEDMLRSVDLADKPLAAYTQADFESLTAAVSRWGVGNAVERCLVAAQIIVQHDYPWPVMLMRCALAPPASCSSVFLLIRSEHDANNFCIDPLIAGLCEAEQRGFTGSLFNARQDSPAAFAQSQAAQFLYCYSIDTAGPSFRRSADIPGLRALHAIAQIDRNDEGALAVQLLGT